MTGEVYMGEEKRSGERRHTPESVAEDLLQCKTEVGQQMEMMNGKINEHITAFDEFKKDFEDMLNIIRDGRGFFRILKHISTAVKWVAGLVAAGVAIWAAIFHDHWPK